MSTTLQTFVARYRGQRIGTRTEAAPVFVSFACAAGEHGRCWADRCACQCHQAHGVTETCPVCLAANPAGYARCQGCHENAVSF